MEDIFMLEKIQNRINKEVEKILQKEKLSIPDYFFLEGIISRLKCEQSYKLTQDDTSKLVNKIFDFLTPLKEEEHRQQCNKETLI